LANVNWGLSPELVPGRNSRGGRVHRRRLHPKPWQGFRAHGVRRQARFTRIGRSHTLMASSLLGKRRFRPGNSCNAPSHSPQARSVRRLMTPSGVSALVLVSPLLASELRDSASPRQIHRLWLPAPFHHESLRRVELCGVSGEAAAKEKQVGAKETRGCCVQAEATAANRMEAR